MQERINQYWTERAPEFSKLRMQDYNGDLHKYYLEIIKEYLPSLPNVRALDVGTGAGFFALLLRECGAEVTAVDYSDAMLEQAKQNTKSLDVQGIRFIQMDAQNLLFEDESFDFIFTRNVTWILEKPHLFYEHAYRVMANNGVLVNLDANFGKAFKEADERGETPVHPTQTLTQLRERNELTKLLYISEADRPAWDIGILAALGVRKISIELEIQKRLGKEELNRPYTQASKNKSAKPFLISAHK